MLEILKTCRLNMIDMYMREGWRIKLARILSSGIWWGPGAVNTLQSAMVRHITNCC